MASAPASAPAETAPSPAGLLDFLMLVSNLKTTKRTGWVLRDVKEPESIADHMYRISVMTLVTEEAGVDRTRCLKMAIVHDVAEALVGDITPHCKINKEEKKRLEENAIQKIEEMLGPGTRASSEVGSLWREYEAGQSAEALLVKDFDKLEMIIQAYEYENAQPELHLQEFFDSTSGYFKTTTGKALAAELIARREKKLQERGKRGQ